MSSIALKIGQGILGQGRRVPLPLDNIAAAAAYSLRKLRTAYAGAAIRVRNDFLLEADIPFGPIVDASGNYFVSTTALLSHCGSGSGFVSTWYDQSGNSRDAVQAVAANQPMIVNAGVVETLNGKSTLNCAGGKYLQTVSAATWLNNTTYTINSVGALATTTPSAAYFVGTDHASANAGLHIGWRSASVPTIAQFFNDGDGSATATTAAAVFTATNNAGGQISIDGVSCYSGATPNSPLSTNGVLLIGAGVLVLPWGGRLSEITIFTPALSTTNRQTLERNQGATYGITVA